MPDLQRLNANKERILSTIRHIGPSYPSKIAKETGITPLFVSAFLAELFSDKQIKMSNLKVGSSPLYLLEGQEKDLENFVTHLNHRERDAFTNLKKNGILEDERQDPAIRVALRKIKDFANPLNVRLGNEVKLFWKYFATSDDEARNKIQEIVEGKPVAIKKEELAPEKIETLEIKENENEIITKEEDTNIELEQIKENKEVKEKPKFENIEIPRKETKQIKKQEKNKKEKGEESYEFIEAVRNYLSAKGIEVTLQVDSKKKEFVSKIKANGVFGEQEYYLIAKDKKKITSDDLTIALQKAQTEKMPALLISPGELDKRAKEHLNEWKNMIKFEKIEI